MPRAAGPVRPQRRGEAESCGWTAVREAPARAPPQPRTGARRGRPRARAPARSGLAVAGAVGVGLTFLAARRIGVDKVAESAIRSDLTWVLIACGLMVASMFARAASWVAIARAALPGRPVRRRDVTSATMIGVLMSATLPARLGEPARAMVLARRVGRMRETFAVLIGTLVSQTALNILALGMLGAIIVSTTDLFQSSTQKLFLVSFAPLLLLVAVALAPAVVRPNGRGRISRAIDAIRRRARADPHRAAGLPRSPPRIVRGVRPARRLGPPAPRLLGSVRGARPRPLGRDRRRRRGPVRGKRDRGGPGDAVEHRHLPARGDQRPPQGLRCPRRRRARLRLILQAVEIATAVALGVPALVREGVSWSDMRLRALQSAPVRLSENPPKRESGDARVPIR